MYEFTTPNAASGPPKAIPLVNYNVDLYGKITHPVEKLLAEIPYTDGLNVTKLHQIPPADKGFTATK